MSASKKRSRGLKQFAEVRSYSVPGAVVGCLYRQSVRTECNRCQATAFCQSRHVTSRHLCSYGRSLSECAAVGPHKKAGVLILLFPLSTCIEVFVATQQHKK